jgi:hypothetical protein
MNRNVIQKIILVFFLMLMSGNSISQKLVDSIDSEKIKDTVTKKEQRIEEKAERKTALKASDHRFIIKGASFFANLNTTVSFELPPDGLLSANLSLENDFGLADNKVFFIGTFLVFITPRSGLYAQYYNLSRQNSITTEKEYIFLDYKIPVGSEITAFFDTKVFSIGYLLTILRDSKVFLGAYFNVYFMDIGTGVYTNGNNLNKKVEFVAPLPNFGFIASFEIAPWLYLDANVGFFTISLSDFGGSVYDLSTALTFKPTNWLGLSVSYQFFDVNVDTVVDVFNAEIPTNIDYHFSGPALGLTFNF